MPNSLAPIVRSLSDRTSLSLARTSLFRFMALLAVVFAVAAYSLIFLAQELDRSEQVESAFYTRRAVQSLEKSLRVTVKDYAFWSDAYRHLHVKVDDDWAFVRGNIGASLFDDFGFQGLFVVDDANRTVYVPVISAGPVVETTGAGDAFNGGFAVALTEGRDVVDSVRFGCATAGISVTRSGTAPAMPARAEIEALLRS